MAIESGSPLVHYSQKNFKTVRRDCSWVGCIITNQRSLHLFRCVAVLRPPKPNWPENSSFVSVAVPLHHITTRDQTRCRSRPETNTRRLVEHSSPTHRSTAHLTAACLLKVAARSWRPRYRIRDIVLRCRIFPAQVFSECTRTLLTSEQANDCVGDELRVRRIKTGEH